MKILLVWPNKDQFGFKPMSLALLSALLKGEGHQVELFDTTYIDFGCKGNTEVRSSFKIFKPVDLNNYDLSKKKCDLKKELYRKLDEFQPDIVGLSVLSDEIHISFEISELVKKWNQETVVLWGNKAATMDSKRILSYSFIDYLCIGEGINFFPKFVSFLENGENPEILNNIAYRAKDGTVTINPLDPYYQELDSLPYYDWSIFDQRHSIKPFDGIIYRGADHMICWGCPGICTYCINRSYRKLYGSGAGKFIRQYSIDRIIKELKYLVKKWDIEFFKFHDEDFCIKPLTYFRELADKYADQIGIPFTIMANAKNINEEKVKLLTKMNCVSVTIGIETGNERLRQEILKRKETKQEIIRAIQLLNKAGIRTSSFNMLAIPFETRDTVFETIELNRKAHVMYPNAGFFFPLPKTELYELAVKEGMWESDTDRVFQNDRPLLNLPGISSHEMTNLRERFTLYIKFPKSLYKYIERSEKNDEIGIDLTHKLYELFNKYVFKKEGFWDDNGQLARIEQELETIRQGH